MAGPKAKKKKQQQQKHGVDFKKIKRKVGRKLPPPKNATNIQIKSKAIILPEQSVAIEKAGSATSKKGLVLDDLLKQTSHYNSKVRRDALTGIKELILKHPGELKAHKFALIEKLSQRIGDEDRMVKETLYELLKLVIFPGCKEDIQGSLILRMMTYIFRAMTHFSVEARLMAFKFLDLVVQNNSSTFLFYAEKILQNYEDILRSDLFNMQDKSKVKNALLGLVRCLSILLCKSQEDGSHDKETVGEVLLHAYWLNSPKNSTDFSLVTRKLKDLVPVLITRLLELLPSLRSMNSMGLQLLDTELYILQSINLALKFFITKFQKEQKSCHLQSERDEIRSQPDMVIWDQTVSPALMKLLANFPLHSTDQLSAKNQEKHSLLDAEITEIFFNFQEWIDLPTAITNKFLPYIEMLLVEKTSDGKRVRAAIREKQLLSFFPYIPKLLSQHVSDDWKYSLLQAFTQAFMDCNPESKLKFACISILEKMLIHGTETFLDPIDPAILDHQITWIRELPELLIALGDKHPSSSKVVLRLINHLGGSATVHPSFLLEYEGLKSPFQAFFSMSDGEGNICYGPFVRLPRDCQELSLACISQFSCADVPLLKAITKCCLCNDLDPNLLFRIIEVLGRAENIQIADRLGFFVTLLSHLKVIPENEPIEETQLKISSPRTLHKVTQIVCRCLSVMGDILLLLQLLEGIIVSQLQLKPDVENARALLQVICTLDSEPTRLSEENLAGLSDSLSSYLLDIVHRTPIGANETAESTVLLEKARFYYLKPCYFLFIRSRRLLTLVLNVMRSLVDDSSRICAIAELFLSMHKNADMCQTLSQFQQEIGSILLKVSHLQASQENKMTLVERHKIQRALDQLSNLSS
ncbi:uncharacterized protein LOC116207036 isoform X1 [Punica granatum]|uniref:Uncharacterized protein LOC116207036 isoform X1 n=1 Tax=Punica granatum TaxID=22663 RepID=A0A6P8DUB7_PUNGR|nr:uncharacterized protein LOC116207036 isoform X1 [Punica granatum]